MSEVLNNLAQDPYPDRIQDPEKAHAMALAGDAGDYFDRGRSFAAELRQNAKEAQPFVDNDDRRKEFEAEFIYPYSGYDDRNDCQSDRNGDEVDEVKAAITPKEFISNAIQKAIEVDAVAERYEYWAGVLHDYPISDEYKKELGKLVYMQDDRFLPPFLDGDDFCVLDVGDMVRLEAKIEDSHTKIQSWEQQMTRFKRGYADENLLSTRFELLKSFDGLMGDVWYSNWRESRPIHALDALLAHDDTTIGEVVELYKQLLQEKIDWLGEAAERAKAFLSDIESGRASQGRSSEQMYEDEVLGRNRD